MKIFKKDLIAKNDQLFPNPEHLDKKSNGQEIEYNLSENNLSIVMNYLFANEKFMKTLEDGVANQLLNTLLQKYNFEPTDKYWEEVEHKKQYVIQLDEYLKERQELNMSVDSELKQFLTTTTHHLSKALEDFTLKIHRQVRDVETRHGMDIISNLITKTNKDEK